MERAPPQTRKGFPSSSLKSFSTNQASSSANCSEISEMSCRDKSSTLCTVKVRNQYERSGLLTMPFSFRINGTERRFAHAGQNIESHGQGNNFTSPVGL